MIGRLGRMAARMGLLLLSFLSGTYALLAFIPFTYQAVIKFPMVSWIPSFVRLHPFLFLAFILANLLLDRPRLQGPEASRPMRIFATVALVFCLAILLHPPLSAIRNDGTSLAWALAFLALPLWLLILDASVAWNDVAWRSMPGDEVRRLFLAAMASGLVAALVFPALSWLRLGPPDPRPSLEAMGMVWGWTLCAHLLVFLAAAVLILGVLSLGRLFPWGWVEPALLLFLVWVALTKFLMVVVFLPIAFQGLPALVVGALVSALALVFLVGLIPGIKPFGDGVENSLDLALRPLAHLLGGRLFRLLGFLVLLAVATGFALARAAVFDWNFLFQKSLVAAFAVTLFAGLYAAIGSGRPKVVWVWALLLMPVLAMNVFLAFDEVLAIRSTARRGDQRLGAVLDQQMGRDVSVRLLKEALSPLQQIQRTIYRVLQKNSNIPHETRTDPVDVQHVDELKAVPGPKPDIYIFVVDSLRRDYLGAYNPKVRFTPELDRFAAESTAIRNAFTRYGATGLSEPSIWTGSLMLHKQYITPFHPMNSLQKLLETDGYQGLISVDSIMDVVVKQGPWMSPLDPGVGTQDLRLEASLGKLEAAIKARRDTRPLFVYSQCQDIHISVINREGPNTVVPGDYSGFYAPYASRIRRLDAAFGKFVAFLKQQGRFENSLIIFTADHGDSLGEEGRFGHAYTLFPEIVRIPMLIHLPASLRQGLVQEPESPAFSIDITPTLYYLLGHRPIKVDRALGRPLFTATAEEQTRYKQDHYLLASSYGAVFGVLDGAGKMLYISDGVNFADHLYRLDEGPAGSARPLSPEQKARYDKMILDDIELVNHFYRFKAD